MLCKIERKRHNTRLQPTAFGAGMLRHFARKVVFRVCCLARIGALIGQAVGAVINSQMVGPGEAIRLIRQLGIQLPFGTTPTDIATGYWGGIIGSTGCLGLFDVALMAGLGALGGLFWWQMSGSKRTVSTPPNYGGTPPTE